MGGGRVLVGAWCWQDGGRRLRMAGCLGAHGAALLVADVGQRTAPREIGGDFALTRAGAEVIQRALPPIGSLAGRGRAVHDIRNTLTVLRLRLQLLAPEAPAPDSPLIRALLGVDAVSAAVDRLASAT
jgi:hypothetical protein